MTEDEDQTITIIMEQVQVPSTREELTPSQRMTDILAMIEDPDKPVSDINRVIAGEIASTTGEISCLAQASGYKLKFLTERVKALRELSKTLSEAEVLSKKDILNFDGPKFQYVFQEIIGVVRKSARDSGLTEEQVNSMLRSFRDSMALREPELRKQTTMVDSSFIKR